MIQTDWNPESEYGATYNLVGAGYQVDKQRQAVRGPLVVEGRPTGVDVEVRAGGPIIDFQTIKTLFDDRSITFSFMTTDEAARNYAAMPTISVVAPPRSTRRSSCGTQSPTRVEHRRRHRPDQHRSYCVGRGGSCPGGPKRSWTTWFPSRIRSAGWVLRGGAAARWPPGGPGP